VELHLHAGDMTAPEAQRRIDAPRPDNGFVDIPAGPGLGMNLPADAQKIRPPLSKPISMRPHFDGFIVDQ
jgi:galactonate dehydratase